MGGHVAHVGKLRNVYEIFAGKPDGKRPLRTTACRGQKNVKIRVNLK
jgi:hypothetical protein